MATVAVLFAVVGCSGAPSTDEQWAMITEQELLTQGVRAEVAACVVDVGRVDLARGPLSEAATDELVRSCTAARSVIDQADHYEWPAPDLAMIDQPWVFGDDAALDELWAQCEQGLGSACNELFERSPVGSAYEDFGVSCGGRPDVLDCVELDQIPAPE